MKRYYSVVLLIALFLCLSLPLFSCSDNGARVPDGTYSGVVADCGEEYVFSGRRVRLISYIFGEIAVDFSGTYTLSGDEIAFRFSEDKDGIYSRTLRYSIAEDGRSITIDGDVFRLVGGDDATTD